MDYLPQNQAILVSSINMLLRDAERSPIELGERPCPLRLRGNNSEPEKIKAILHDAGYVYNEEQEQFKPIGFDQ